jgi:hypothetical protein
LIFTETLVLLRITKQKGVKMDNEQQVIYPEIMTMEQICGYLAVHRDIVKGYVEDGMPYFTLTKSPTSHKRFKKSDIDQWITTKRTKKD